MVYLGDDAYLVFAIREPQPGAVPPRHRAELRERAATSPGWCSFASDAAEAAGKGVLGVVRPGGSGRRRGGGAPRRRGPGPRAAPDRRRPRGPRPGRGRSDRAAVRSGALGLIALLVGGSAGAAHADRREASLHAHVVGGSRRHHRRRGAGSRGAAGRARGARRLRHPTTASSSTSRSRSSATGGAGFPDGTFHPAGRPPVSGPFAIATRVTRLDGGATLAPRRARGSRRCDSPAASRVATAAPRCVTGRRRARAAATPPGAAAPSALDLVATATAGLDHRLGRRCIVGAAAGGSLALPLGGESFRTFEVTLHAAYYWYPR